MEIENQNSFDAALIGGFNLFVGAGFSVLAKNGSGLPLPVGMQLKELLLKEFGKETLATLDLPKLCTIIKRTQHDSFRAYLNQQFAVVDWDKSYAALEEVAIRSIFTTNIDNLIPRIYEESMEHYINDLTVNGPTYADRRSIDYIPLHGSVTNPNAELLFSTVEMAAAFSANPDTWRTLRTRMRERPTLFCGYRVEDADTLQALEETSSLAKSTNDRWIVVRPQADGRGAPEEEYFRALGFQVVRGDTSSLLDHFLAVRRSARSAPTVSRTVGAEFASETVPPPHTRPCAPVRGLPVRLRPSVVRHLFRQTPENQPLQASDERPPVWNARA